MKNKIIISALVILAGAFIFENAYLLGSYNKEKAQKPVYTQYQPVSLERLPEKRLPALYETRSWDPFSEMNRMQERMNRIFENSFSEIPASSSIRENEVSTGSSMSFSNIGSAYIVKVSMPGMDKNDINIQVKGRQLIISGENRKNKTNKNKNSYSRESSYGNFLSNFMLPEDAQISRITSDYKDGVLTITIPKSSKEVMKTK